MKKILLFAFMLTVSASAFAVYENNAPMCTIVVSPCEQVPNTMFEGAATDAQIKEAQDRMARECEFGN